MAKSIHDIVRESRVKGHEKAVKEQLALWSKGEITQEQYLNGIARCIGAKPVTKKVPYCVARQATFMMELFGHLFRTRRPPLVTRYSVWLIGRQCFFSSEKARSQLGWRPTIDYDEGIERAVKWCLENSL